MRWSVVRLIGNREMRDLLRDRRTLFMLLGLPVILYPAFGIVGFLFAQSLLEQSTPVGVAGAEHLPHGPAGPPPAAPLLLAGLAVPADAGPVGGAGAVAAFAATQHALPLPPLTGPDGFHFCDMPFEQGTLPIVRLDSADPGPLTHRQVDVMLVVEEGFAVKLQRGERPALTVIGREGDETSKFAVKRLTGVIGRWEGQVLQVLFLRRGLPADFDDPVRVENPEESKPFLKKTANDLRDALVRLLPFLLVMWTMAGALHPAIDLCAGEKERGTMETLLISPAERGEIVAGKFLAVWVFSVATALWNLAWMGGGAIILSQFLPFPVISVAGLSWCVLLTLPLGALFSAVCLGLGVYARSTKEGQYYLLPMFLITLPLVFLSVAPGIRLNLGYSLVPITGTALLMQRLMAVSPEPAPWAYFVPVLASLGVCVLLALRWAVKQFHREDVLFREAERLDLRLWLRRTFGGKG